MSDEIMKKDETLVETIGSEDLSGAPMSEEEVDKILRKVDAESRTRHLSNIWEKLVVVIAVAFTLFQLYTAIFGALSPQVQRSSARQTV